MWLYGWERVECSRRREVALAAGDGQSLDSLELLRFLPFHLRFIASYSRSRVSCDSHLFLLQIGGPGQQCRLHVKRAPQTPSQSINSHTRRDSRALYQGEGGIYVAGGLECPRAGLRRALGKILGLQAVAPRERIVRFASSATRRYLYRTQYLVCLIAMFVSF